MKALRNISLTVVLLASLSACVENDPTYNVYPSDDVAFTYHITNEGRTRLSGRFHHTVYQYIGHFGLMYLGLRRRGNFDRR